jgi:peroxiredoxin
MDVMRLVRIRGSQGDLTLVLLLLAASLGLNVYLAPRALRAPRPVPPPPTLSVGEVVPPLEAQRLQGRRETVSYADEARPTVVYVFSPSCPWCRKNLANIKRLFEARQGEYRFVGLSSDDTQLADYVAENGLAFPVYSGIAEPLRRAYKLGGVPQTLVISPQGKVLKNWQGAYAGPNQTDVEAFFAVKLPGLS